MKRKLTIEGYHALADAGILTEDDRVELIEGEIIEMAPIGGPHISGVNVLNETLVTALAGRAIVSVQNPIVLSGATEPQPDIAILKHRADYYGGERIAAADVLWLIEVADSSIRYDRSVKVPLYARHEIPEAWIIDIAAQCIEVLRKPKGGEYLERFQVLEGGAASPTAFPDLVIQWSLLFGKRAPG
jgi:Uma2 family endonuclease